MNQREYFNLYLAFFISTLINLQKSVIYMNWDPLIPWQLDAYLITDDIAIERREDLMQWLRMSVET